MSADVDDHVARESTCSSATVWAMSFTGAQRNARRAARKPMVAPLSTKSLAELSTICSRFFPPPRANLVFKGRIELSRETE
jgi:hypothetical protein